MESTANKLMQIAGEHFQVDVSALAPDTDFFEKLNINSLQALSLLSKLESAFSVEIPDYELIDVRTFQQLADVIDERL